MYISAAWSKRLASIRIPAYCSFVSALRLVPLLGNGKASACASTRCASAGLVLRVIDGGQRTQIFGIPGARCFHRGRKAIDDSQGLLVLPVARIGEEEPAPRICVLGLHLEQVLVGCRGLQRTAAASCRDPPGRSAPRGCGGAWPGLLCISARRSPSRFRRRPGTLRPWCTRSAKWRARSRRCGPCSHSARPG